MDENDFPTAKRLRHSFVDENWRNRVAVGDLHPFGYLG
jgi:hypothetical protein